MTVRSSYLDDARENGTRQAVSRGLLLTAGGGSAGGSVTGTLVRFVDLDVGVSVTTTAERAEVIVHGETVWIPADPGAYVLGGQVVVMVDGTGRPVRVTGPAGTVPAPVEGVPSPVVVHRPDLVIDAESRAASTAAGEAAAQAQADAEAAREWVDETGTALVGRLGATEAGLDAAESLLEAVRARVGRKQWVPADFVIRSGGVDYAHVTPLGGGRLRFEWLLAFDNIRWSVAGDPAAPVAGTSFTYTFAAPGSYTVNVDRVSPVLTYILPVTVTAEMMGPADDQGEWVDIDWPEVDWSQAEIALSQLRDAGVLDPDVLAALYEDVVVAGISIATEAFIGGNAILENSVQARHVVASESMSAKLAQFLKVATDMLYVGGMNLLPDPRFEDEDLSEARRSRSGATAAGSGFTNTSYFYWVPVNNAENVRRWAIPVTGGEQYRVEIPVTLSSVLSTTPRFETWNASGAGRVLGTGTDWTYENGVLSYVVTVPSTAAYMAPVIYRTTSYTLMPGTRVALMSSASLISRGAVTAPAMNVVTTASGATLRIDPDGIRLWRAGNPPATGSPNLTMTSGDGFRVQADDGTGLMWIDPATGDLHTAGNVTSGGRITGSEIIGATVTGGTVTGTAFSGGSISIANTKGGPIFSTSQSGGVQIGGARNIYTRTTPVTSTNQLLTMSSTVGVDPARTYRCRFLVTRSAGWQPETGHVQAVWDSGVVDITPPYLPPVTGTGTAIEVDVVAPAGASSLYLRWTTTDPVPAGENITTSLVSIGEVSSSSVQVSGAVSAPLGQFTVVGAGEIRGQTGIGWDPSDTGWLPFDLTANWMAAAGYEQQRRRRGDLVYLRGEIIAVATGSVSTITTLPSGWRPAQRVRVPWGWSTWQGWVEVLPDGQVRASEGARTSSPGMSLAAIPPFSIL